MLSALLSPTLAQAHMGFSRFDVVEGFLNPLLDMNTLLLPVVTGLWVAFGERRPALRLVVFSLAVLVGAVVQLAGVVTPGVDTIVSVCLLVTGLAAAAGWGADLRLAAVWLGLSGGMLGQLNLAHETDLLRDPLLFAVGVAAGSALLAVYFAAVIRARRFSWLPMAGRVLASWITAAGLMVWALRLT